MKQVDDALRTVLDSSVYSLATFFLITKNDSVVASFTDHDTDLIIDSVTYSSAGATELSGLSMSTEFDVSNTEVHGIIESGSITEAQIKNREFENASIQVFLADYENLPATKTSTSVLYLITGVVGEVVLRNNSWYMEIRSFKQMLKQIVGDVTSRFCRADLGDGKCRKDLTSFTYTGTITAVSGKQITTDIVGIDESIARDGKLTVASKGYVVDVHAVSGSVVTTYDDIEATNLVGESVEVITGCDKTLNFCRRIYNNVLNFQGEPHVPTSDEWAAGFNQTARTT